MADISVQKQAPVGHWKASKVLLSSLGATLLIGYPAGMLLNVLSGNRANCIELIDISGCPFPNPFVYYIGLVYAVPLCLGIFHFGFTDKKRWWYYLIAVLFAKFLYVGNDSLVYEIAAIGGGAVAGLLISVLRGQRPA